MEKLLYSRLSTNIPVLFFQQTTEVKKRPKKIQTDKQSPEMLTIKETALRTGVSEHFIRSLCKKKEIILNVFKNRVSDIFTNFLLVVIDHNRINELNNIKDAYKQILDNYRKILEVDVYSKYPLTDIQKNDLTQKLKEYYKKEIKINEFLDNSILAGIKVVVGNEIIDGTALTKMNKLKDILKG